MFVLVFRRVSNAELMTRVLLAECGAFLLVLSLLALRQAAAVVCSLWHSVSRREAQFEDVALMVASLAVAEHMVQTMVRTRTFFPSMESYWLWGFALCCSGFLLRKAWCGRETERGGN